MANILETKALTKRFGGIVANRGINLAIEQGKTTGLIGPNGSGKSTFINQISGMFPPTSGSILFGGEEISRKPACEIASMGIARTFQRIQLFGHLNVVENVLVSRCKFMRASALDIALGTARVRHEEKAQFDKAMEFLGIVGLDGDAWKLPSNLPYGKRRALEIARALALEPLLLLLDEPAAGMTKEEFVEILRIMEILKERKITMLLVEHTMEFIRKAVDRVYVLNFGEVIAQGSFEEIERNKAVISAYLGDENE
jgi:ABC-type branched-subunit amino acid transport system ATPase component